MSKKGQEGSRRTTFKKGNVPANRRPIGSERIDKDGYILIKMQDGHKNNNWIKKHRYLYEQAYGKIPKGHKVIFADGNNRNFDLDNLVLITDAEGLIMNRNKLFKKDKDLTKAGVSINIYAFLKAQKTNKPVELCCAIGDEFVDGKPYSEIVEIARKYINNIGGFEKFAEWGLF